MCRKETPYANVTKIGTVGHIDYVITQIGFGRDRPTHFGVARHQISPLPIDFVHRPYNSAPATAGACDVCNGCGYVSYTVCACTRKRR